MSKDKFYFSHDSNARRDPKMIDLMSKFGSSGYGMFWILIEVLREQRDYRLDLTRSFIVNSVAIEMYCKPDHLISFIHYCIEIDLIESDGVFIWSNSLNERMSIYEEKKSRYSKMAKKRWETKGSIHHATSSTDESSKSDDEFNDVLDKLQKEKKFNFKKELMNIGVSDKTASTWLEVRRKKGAVNSEMAFNRVKKQIELSGFNAEFCISTAAEKSWHGFEAKYLEGIATTDKGTRNQMVY